MAVYLSAFPFSVVPISIAQCINAVAIWDDTLLELALVRSTSIVRFKASFPMWLAGSSVNMFSACTLIFIPVYPNK